MYCYSHHVRGVASNYDAVAAAAAAADAVSAFINFICRRDLRELADANPQQLHYAATLPCETLAFKN